MFCDQDKRQKSAFVTVYHVDLFSHNTIDIVFLLLRDT